jgi:hypothetical protein
MARSYLTLRAPLRGDPARLHKCERRGQYWKVTLIERYGADENLVDRQLQLALRSTAVAPIARGHPRNSCTSERWVRPQRLAEDVV